MTYPPCNRLACGCLGSLLNKKLAFWMPFSNTLADCRNFFCRSWIFSRSAFFFWRLQRRFAGYISLEPWRDGRSVLDRSYDGCDTFAGSGSSFGSLRAEEDCRLRLSRFGFGTPSQQLHSESLAVLHILRFDFCFGFYLHGDGSACLFGVGVVFFEPRLGQGQVECVGVELPLRRGHVR